MSATTDHPVTPQTSAPPIAEWVTIDDLYRDPFPVYRRLRAESPIHWVPAIDRYLVTGYSVCHEIDNDPDTFTANEDDSLQKLAMGHSMLRKDDPEHAYERKSYGNVLKPRAIKETWTRLFEENTEKYLTRYQAMGPGTDLHRNFAAPFAAENLRQILGFENATHEDLQRWSQDMMDGTGNYANDPAVWTRCYKSFDEVDVAIDELVPRLQREPNGTLLSQVLEYKLPMESVRANIKMTIGGGLNEPRDVLGTLVWGLLSNPVQADAVRQNPALFTAAFEEAVRWVAPIGMYSRQTTREIKIGGATLPAGAKLGVNVGAANRDPAHFDDPEAFNISRDKQPHLGFGSGVHFCAGAWIAKAMVAQVAVPALFTRLPDLALDSADPAVAGGWVFRGMLSLPLTWSA